MKRNKRGFTLIELLAVIVILAIIALIATPIVLDIIKDSKESAIKQNAVAMASVAEKRCMSLEMNKENRAFRVEYEDGKEKIGEGLSSLEGTFKGDNPSYGQIDVNDKCDVAMALYDNSTQLCLYKEHNNDKILSVKTSKIDTCNVDNIKEGIFPMPDEDSDGNDDEKVEDEVVVIPPIDVGFSCGETNPDDVDPTLFTYTDNADGTVTLKGVASGVTLPTDLKIPCYNSDGKMITDIGSSALSSKNLTSVLMGNNIKTIGDNAFKSNPITTLELGNGVETIGKAAFASNGALIEVTLPDSLKVLDGKWASDGAFYNNSKLEKVTFGSGIETIGEAAFYNCKKLSTVDLSRAANLKTIRDWTFYSNKSLTELDLSNSTMLTSIGSNAFGDNVLTSVKINATSLMIGSGAFSNNKIANLEILGTTVSIENNAFKDNLISELTIKPKIILLGVDAFKNNQLPDNQAFIMGRDTSGNETTVLTSYGGANRNNITIPENVESITGSFSSLSLTGTLDIGNKITAIPANTFKSNTLSKVIIKNNIKTIGDSAFSSNSIATLELGNGVETIGKAAFANNKVTEVTLPDSLKVLDGRWSSEGSFYKNTLLEKVTFGSGIETLGEAAFYNCTKLATVDFSRAINLKTIGMHAFSGNGKLIEVDLSNSPNLTNISSSAFYNNALTSVKLNATSLTSVGASAFASNPNLASITLIGKVEGDTSLTLGSSWNGTCTNIIYQ